MRPQTLIYRPIPCLPASFSSQRARFCKIRNTDVLPYKALAAPRTVAACISSHDSTESKGAKMLGFGTASVMQKNCSGIRFTQACAFLGEGVLLTTTFKQKSLGFQLQVRAVTTPTESETSFDNMITEMKRKYYLLGGKGGVGKTSCAASLAVKFANSGHPTLVVSTDPAHSLSDSFDQNLSGGKLVAVEGTDSPLFALEIDPEQARAEFRSSSQNNNGSGVKDIMDSMGLGGLAEQVILVDYEERSKPQRTSPFCLQVEEKLQEDRGQIFLRP